MEASRAEGESAERPARSSRSGSSGGELPRWLPLAFIVAGALALVAAIVLAALSLLGGDDRLEVGQPTEVSVQELRAFAGASDHATYWAGTVPGFKLELTETEDGNDYLRYLPQDVAIGDAKPTYTTIGSYPVDDAYGVATRSAKENNLEKLEVPGGGIAVVRDAKPRTVYLAYPGSNVLAEVYAADPNQAQDLAASGKVGPVE